MNYIEKLEIFNAMLASQKSECPTEEYALLCQKMARHMLRGRQFSNYSQPLKEDMEQHAMLRCMKAIKSFDSNKTDNAFGYVTRTIYTAFLQVLKSHYKQVNIKKAMLQKIFAEFDALTNKNLLESYNNDGWDEDD